MQSSEPTTCRFNVNPGVNLEHFRYLAAAQMIDNLSFIHTSYSYL
jgi:hypothetical protein